jgi:predicted alpha-1,6-mannanase (GH76 family)
MRRRAARLPLALLVAGMAACGGSSSGSRATVTSAAVAAAPATSATTPAQAMAAYDAFVAGYWDPNTGNFFKNSDHQLTAATLGSLLAGQFYSDFWWEAHFFETTLDAYELTGGAALRQQIDAVYDGFVAMPWHVWTLNPYNDDLTWWALALARAYEITGEARFRDRAAAIFQSVAAFEDGTFGGGIWWKRDGTDAGKNVCINAPFAMTALHLYAWTGDAAYLACAKRVYAFLQARLVQGGTVYDTIGGTGAGTLASVQFTYNYGTFIGASLALADATGDPTYVSNAVAVADVAMATLAPNGILRDEGSGDCAGFRMIFTRYLCRLAQRGQPGIAAFLDANARTAWSHRRADGLMGEDWTITPVTSASIQSFAAGCAVDLQFHALVAASPASTPPPIAPTAVAPFANVTLTADQATTNATLGTQNPGFTGTAYVTSWSQGQSVAFAVTAPVAGEYLLAFRYSAGSGDASRSVSVNGSTVLPFSLVFPASAGLTFPATPAWGDWHETSLVTYLPAGANTVSIAFDAAAGSANALDLDAIKIAPSPSR